MAEALSVISGIAAVLSISSEVCRKVSLFVLSTTWAGKNERDLQIELFRLSRALARVQNVLLDYPDSSPDALRLDPALGYCRAVLQELEMTYSYQTSMNRLRRRLTWTKKPLGGSNPSPDLKRLERCRRLLEQWQPLPERISGITLYNGTDQTTVIDTPIINQRSEILQWLSPLDHRDKHHELRRVRVKGIEAPIIKTAVFSDWSGEEEAPQALWCYGLPGVGKTMTASFVVDNLSEDNQAKDSQVAYYYFDYKNQQLLSEVVAVLIKQFCLSKTTIPPAVLELYDGRAEDEQRPSLSSLLVVLQLLSAQVKHSYIILDALDEHALFTKRGMQQLIQGLKGTSSRIFLTSRPKVSLASELLASCSKQVEIVATKEDIYRYIEHRIALSPALNYLDHGLKNSVIKVLVTSSQVKVSGTSLEGNLSPAESNADYSLKEAAIRDESGHNFLVAVLQIDWFLGQFTTQRDVKTALRRIPSSFNGTLDEASRRLLNPQSATDRALAGQTLKWILYAKRPLSTRELCQALAITTDGGALNERALPTPDAIIKACAGLITVDESSSTISLVHYSVYEHFRERRGRLFPQGPRQLALACISYLIHESFETTGFSDEKSIDTFRSYPFLDYAAHTWTSHCRDRHSDDAVVIRELDPPAKIEYLQDKSELVQQISSMTLSFLQDHKSRIVSLTSKEASSITNQPLVPMLDRYKEGITSLHLAARFGLCDEVSELLANGNADASAAYGTVPDKNNSRKLGITPLHEAAWVGAVDVTSLLLKYGADPLCCDAHSRTPLHYAAGCGRNGILKVLLETGKYDSPDLRDVNQHTPLHLAAFAGHANIIQVLLTFGAKIGLFDSTGRTALHLAAENGHSAVCARLIAAGSDLKERDKSGLTPLHSAAKSGQELVVRTLIGRGADLCATTVDLLTPLHCATLKGNQSVVKSLLTNGADINAKDGKGETPLFMAVNNGDYEMTEVLLTRGADVELRNSEGCTVSSYADSEGQGMIISLLRQYSA